ncbi:unnamed protein product, partial [Symbiodinium necroappetens]
MGAYAGYGLAVHNGKCAMRRPGIQDMLAYYTTNAFATGSKNSLAFQLRGIKQNRCTSPDVMAFMGSKDMLCSVATLNIGLEDRLAQLTIEESATGFKKSLAFQPHGIKQSRGSSGEGIWITKRQPSSACTSPDVEALMGSKDTLCKVVMLNIGLEDMLACFTVVAGFKKMLAFQPRGIKQRTGSPGEGIWINTRFGGHARTLRYGGVCGWHQAEQRLD